MTGGDQTALTARNTELYQDYYARRGQDRNDPLGNPEVLFQLFAGDAALVRSLRPLSSARERLRVLDVGCGNGNTLLTLIALGFNPANLTGIDLIPERIAEARTRVAGARLLLADARQLEFQSESFDLVVESTMFLQMTDEGIASAIAAEMIRVTAPGGSIVLRDWRMGNPRDPTHAPLTKKRARALFHVGLKTDIVSHHRGALLPPLGRFLSRRAPWAYFLVQSMVPMLSAQMVTRLRKIDLRT